MLLPIAALILTFAILMAFARVAQKSKKELLNTPAVVIIETHQAENSNLDKKNS